MTLHKSQSVVTATKWAAVIALCAAPLVAAADNSFDAHYGRQDRGGSQESSYNDNDNQNNDGGYQGNQKDDLLPDLLPLVKNSEDPPSEVPEPGTLALALVGGLGLLGVQMRRRYLTARSDEA